MLVCDTAWLPVYRDVDTEKGILITDTGVWILDTGCGYWILDTGVWILDTRMWILDTVVMLDTVRIRSVFVP